MEAGAPSRNGDRVDDRLRRAFHPAVSIGLLAAAIGLTLFGVDRYRHRYVESSADLIRLLPEEDGTIFFADIAALRKTPMMRLVVGANSAQAQEYATFLNQTGFDFARDVDEVSGWSDGNTFLFAIRGRFDWGRLQAYGLRHGGANEGNFCVMEGSQPGRWVSLVALQADVLGVGVSAERSSAKRLLRRGNRTAASDAPIWVSLSQALLRNPKSLPMPLQIFTLALQPADSVTLSGRAATNGSAAFDIQMDAACAESRTADTIRRQLEIQTKMLKLQLARQQGSVNPADFTGLLTSGQFRSAQGHVIGTWPVSRELLATLQ